MKRAMGVMAIAVAGATMLVGASGAGAAPKKGLSFDVTCPGMGTFAVTTPPGNGAFTPAIGANNVFTPYEVQGVVTVDGAVVDEFHDVKRAPLPPSAISCTFVTSFDDNGAQIVISGVAVVAPRGRA